MEENKVKVTPKYVSKRVRVPITDADFENWVLAQAQFQASIRMLIKQHIADNGDYVDVLETVNLEAINRGLEQVSEQNVPHRTSEQSSEAHTDEKPRTYSSLLDSTY